MFVGVGVVLWLLHVGLQWLLVEVVRMTVIVGGMRCRLGLLGC